MKLEGQELKTKDAIYHAALELFAEKGFYAVSLRDISRRVNCHVSAINYYYQSKEALYNLCLYQDWDSFSYILNQTLRDVSTNGEFCDKIRYIIYHTIEFIVLNPLKSQILSKVVYDFSVSIEEGPLAEMVEIIHTLEHFIKLAQDKNVIQKKNDPQFISNYIFGTCFTLGMSYFRRVQNKYKKERNFIIYTTEQLSSVILNGLN